VERFRAGTTDAADLRRLTNHLLAQLARKAPGGAVEVRVPPYAVVQRIQGTRHAASAKGQISNARTCAIRSFERRASWVRLIAAIDALRVRTWSGPAAPC